MISFELPHNLIAQEPARPRDSAKLLVYDRSTKTITDTVFARIGDFLPKQTTLVLNNSKVEHCRYLFEPLGIELFVLQKIDTHTLHVMVRPGRKFKLGGKVALTEWLEAEVLAIDADGFRVLRLNVPHDDPRLDKFTHVPLPPYIQQNDTLAAEYQTVYAEPIGSKAAPTAGLHFTKSLLQVIARTHPVTYLTLHVGLGTFAKLTQQQLNEGKLHSEAYELGAEAAAVLNSASHITAVGTTSVRTLESAISEGRYAPTLATTDILIQPPYAFKAVSSMVTNFHLPGTSLLLLVEAFVGSEPELQRIYNHAIANHYRFYSFGDAMLVL